VFQVSLSNTANPVLKKREREKAMHSGSVTINPTTQEAKDLED
jgi:hypothetical protein